MHASEEQSDGVHSELIDMVRDWSGTRSGIDDEQTGLLVAWTSREANLALRRAYEMMADGVPFDTAFFLAADDMGFQLALAFVKSTE